MRLTQSSATRAANLGVWDFDIRGSRLEWDDTMYRVYGIKPDQFTGTFEAWQACVHPEDLPKATEEVQMALRGEKEFNAEFRILWPDRSVRYIKAIALVQRDASGEAIRMLGTNSDITEIVER